MAKAIHWPLAYLEAVQQEAVDTLYAAVRLGSLYANPPYWMPDEVVTLRVNHQPVRDAVVVGELKCCPLIQLTAADYAALKPGLQNPEALLAFLQATYAPQPPLTLASEVTVVYYRPLAPKAAD